MKPIVRNILAVIAGWIIGVVVNSSIVQLGMSTYPDNIDINDMESLGNFLQKACVGKGNFISGNENHCTPSVTYFKLFPL